MIPCKQARKNHHMGQTVWTVWFQDRQSDFETLIWYEDRLSITTQATKVFLWAYKTARLGTQLSNIHASHSQTSSYDCGTCCSPKGRLFVSGHTFWYWDWVYARTLGNKSIVGSKTHCEFLTCYPGCTNSPHTIMVSELQDKTQHGTDCPIWRQAVWLPDELSDIETECTQGVKASKVSQESGHNCDMFTC